MFPSNKTLSQRNQFIDVPTIVSFFATFYNHKKTHKISKKKLIHAEYYTTYGLFKRPHSVS